MTIAQYQSVHECEEIHLQLNKPCTYKTLKDFIFGLGGYQEEDCYFFKREDLIEPWQEENYAAIQPITDSAYSSCNNIWFSCFLAEVPESQTWKFLNLFEKFLCKFDSHIFHHNTSHFLKDLKEIFHNYICEIRENWGLEPGGKKIYELIDSSAYYEASRVASAAGRDH